MQDRIETCNPDCRRLDQRGTFSEQEVRGGALLLAAMRKILVPIYSSLDMVGSLIVDRELRSVLPTWDEEVPVKMMREKNFICGAAEGKPLGTRLTTQLAVRRRMVQSTNYKLVGQEKIVADVSLTEIPCLVPERKDVPSEWEKALRMRMYRPPTR